MLTIIRFFALAIVLILALAYMVEWHLGRVQLKQSILDIRLVIKGMIDHFRKPKAGS